MNMTEHRLTNHFFNLTDTWAYCGTRIEDSGCEAMAAGETPIIALVQSPK